MEVMEVTDPLDQEAEIKDWEAEISLRMREKGAYELPVARQEVRRELSSSASALTNLNPGFAFLPEPEETGSGEEPKVLIEKVTPLPEPEPDSDPEQVEIKLVSKQQAFSRLDPDFEAPIEYPFW